MVELFNAKGKNYLNKHIKSRGGSKIPCRRGADPPGGAPTYDFVKFSRKLHEIEKILGRRGAPPLDPPLKRLGSANLQPII